MALLAVEMAKVPHMGGGVLLSLAIAVRNEDDHGEYRIFSSKSYESPRRVQSRRRSLPIYYYKVYICVHIYVQRYMYAYVMYVSICTHIDTYTQVLGDML